jgi:hypothetical protein
MIKKSYSRLAVLILTFIVSSARAQNDESGVKAVINQLFDGMKRSDTAAIRNAFAATPVLQTVMERKGRTWIESEPLDSFLVAIARPHTAIYEERISFDLIRVDGSLAIAWTPYKFYVGDKFSHCGVDSYQLVKINGSWKIQYLIDTRRAQPCQ